METIVKPVVFIRGNEWAKYDLSILVIFNKLGRKSRRLFFIRKICHFLPIKDYRSLGESLGNLPMLLETGQILQEQEKVVKFCDLQQIKYWIFLLKLKTKKLNENC